MIEETNKKILQSLFINRNLNTEKLNSFNVNLDLLKNVLKSKFINGFNEDLCKNQLKETAKYCKTIKT